MLWSRTLRACLARLDAADSSRTPRASTASPSKLGGARVFQGSACARAAPRRVTTSRGKRLRRREVAEQMRVQHRGVVRFRSRLAVPRDLLSGAARRAGLLCVALDWP